MSYLIGCLPSEKDVGLSPGCKGHKLGAGAGCELSHPYQQLSDLGEPLLVLVNQELRPIL